MHSAILVLAGQADPLYQAVQHQILRYSWLGQHVAFHLRSVGKAFGGSGTTTCANDLLCLKNLSATGIVPVTISVVKLLIEDIS